MSKERGEGADHFHNGYSQAENIFGGDDRKDRFLSRKNDVFPEDGYCGTRVCEHPVLQGDEQVHASGERKGEHTVALVLLCSQHRKDADVCRITGNEPVLHTSRKYIPIMHSIIPEF